MTETTRITIETTRFLPLRLWGVRHARYFYLKIRYTIWWARIGRFLGCWMNPNDVEFLEAVWKGR